MSSLPDPESAAQLPPDGGEEFNRLVHETSPYLLQHAKNPVDWYPWGAEALDRAATLDQPIFLSVGYSTCHWCHVMERESFESPAIAELINEHFVPIKVDREERPDLDEIYMKATQLMTGRGGWPNSVWLTPDGRPWYAGTYFPPEDRQGQPGFATLLKQLAEIWKQRRGEVDQQADDLAARTSQLSAGESFEGEVTPELLRRAFVEIESQFDRRHGGFGGAPKFPPHGSLALLFAQLRTEPTNGALQRVACETLDAMAAGGIHDQVGGGFHRYSTDTEWLLPHFEKMLYDNAPLARAYVDGWLLTGDARYRRVAERTYDWVLREMRDEAGGFHSAWDADSEGEEGKFYVWTTDEVLEVLGDSDGTFFIDVANLRPEGNYHDEVTRQLTGQNIPHLSEPLDRSADGADLDRQAFVDRFDRCAQRLYDVRKHRIHPHLDDKVLTSWNGMMIASLAYAGAALEKPEYTEAAVAAASAIEKTMVRDGVLLRSFRGGAAHVHGYLEDYAHWIDALLELYRVTEAKRYLDDAVHWADAMIRLFEDPDAGGFYFASNEHESLLVRSKDPFDQATPSGNGTAARVLVALARHTGQRRYTDHAERTLRAFAGAMDRHPRGTEALLLAVMESNSAPNKAPVTGHLEWWDVARRSGPIEARLVATSLTVAPTTPVEIRLELIPDPGWSIGRVADSWKLEVKGEAIKSSEIECWDDVAHGRRVFVTLDPRAPEATLVRLRATVEPCGLDRCLPPVDLDLAVPLHVTSDFSTQSRI